MRRLVNIKQAVAWTRLSHAANKPSGTASNATNLDFT